LADSILLLDIGTTTISGTILDAVKGRPLASGVELNKQASFGDDVITRIDFALKDAANAPRLQRAVVSSVNTLAGRLLAQAGQKAGSIREAFCVCNTPMHHLFLGIDTVSLIIPPYRANQKSELTIYADRIGLRLKKGCPVTFLPNIGGFVGSDALALIIASKIYKSSSLKLAIDIGTNGEIVLGNREKILVASTAAGPAFEARHISCGMPAIKGAIESVNIRKKGIDLKVIGNVSPKGICGSGLIDATYQMFKSGAMNNSGKMNSQELLLYKKGKLKISITQQDVRKVQLAKAAIYAAIKVLLRRMDIDETAIKEVFITGSFGSTININSVVGIGLIPKVDKKAVTLLNNGALEGLALYVNKPLLHKRLLSILTKLKHIPLMGRGFGEEFTSSLFIG